jgi:hypothetical protein
MTNFSNNTTCRGGALLRVEIMSYPSQHYPDSMANLYYNNNFYNNFVRERDVVLRFDYQRYIKQLKAPLRTEFHELQQAMQAMQQEKHKLWETFKSMQMSILWNHMYVQDDYGI